MMKRFSILVLAAFCASLCVADLATAAGFPLITGTYKTLFGTVQPGRATESMPADFAEGQLGNLIWAESWDGAALGANWKVTCPQIAGPAVLIYDGVVGGTGQRIYNTPYSGGTLWLAGTGAWGGGAPYYEAVLTAFNVVATKQYVNGVLVGVVSNINLTGTFDEQGQCFTMAISNAELVGMTGNPYLPPPAGTWPAFHGPTDCGLTGAHGTYWDVHDVTLTILGDCVVNTSRSTWGQVKSLYR